MKNEKESVIKKIHFKAQKELENTNFLVRIVMNFIYHF